MTTAVDHAAAFWIMRYFSVGSRLTRPLVIDEAAPSKAVRKPGAALFKPFCIVVAKVPSGVMVFAIVLDASIVAATKLRKKVFVR